MELKELEIVEFILVFFKLDNAIYKIYQAFSTLKLKYVQPW